MISDALSRDPGIEVVGTAPDAYVARDMIVQLEPDVLTLDIEMPRMDGLTFLKILQKHKPMPVVVISSISQEGSAAALQAVEAGAVEVLAKPTSAYSIGHLGEQLPRYIRAAAAAKLRPVSPVSVEPAAAAPRPIERVASEVVPGGWSEKQIVLLGASTGGIEALTEVLSHLPSGLPGIGITQHMPPHFSRLFAERVNGACAFEVREAKEGDALRPGLALVAPGDFHMTFKWVAGAYRVELNQKPPVHHCRPAVDVMFRSVAEISDARVVAVILTGMGVDGALGMKLLKEKGARTIAQDEETSVVYGMPRAAVEMGVVDRVLPLKGIAASIVAAVQAQARSARS
jgi:two-component system chemotaxis response regulator CheB